MPTVTAIHGIINEPHRYAGTSAKPEQKIKEKVTRFAPVVGVSPMGVGIRTFKSRLGQLHCQGQAGV